MKKFVCNHIEPGTNIIHDGWSVYSFLDDDEAVWTHECHIHGYHDFGLGESSTSHIEQYWSQIKQIISKIYVIMPKVGYIYYIREAEFRLALKNSNIITMEKSIIKLLKNVFDICNYDFLSEEDIKDNNNYDY